MPCSDPMPANSGLLLESTQKPENESLTDIKG